MKLLIDHNVYAALLKADISCNDILYNRDDFSITCLYRAKDNQNLIAYLNEKRVKEFEKDWEHKLFKYPMDYNNPDLHKLAIMAKAGRVIKKIFPDVDAKKLTNFVSHFTITEGKFEIRENVTKAYASNINSCMQGCNMRFYSDNGIKILVLEVKGKIKGRAIYWPEIYFKTLKKTLPLVDRVYTIDGKDDCQFEKYALKNNCVIGLSGTRFLYQGEEFSCDIEFKLKTMNIDFWPYMDTFVYITEEGVLSNNGEGKCLDCTEGLNPFHSETVWSEYEGECIDEDCAVYSNWAEGHISERNAILINNEWYPEDCDAISSCDDCGKTVLSEDMVQLYNGDYLCENCIVEITAGSHESEYASKHDTDIVEICGGFVCHTDDCVETYNGETYLIDDCIEAENGEFALADDERVSENEDGLISIKWRR